MPAFIALALSVAVLAVLDTWLFIVPLSDSLPGLVWISFLAWGCHFHSGGGFKGTATAVVGMSFGALVGMVAILLATGALSGLGPFAAPVAFGLGAGVICLARAIPLPSAIPASVYGFAAIAAPILLAEIEPAEAIVRTIVSVIIGAAFGYASEALAKALTRNEGDEAAADSDAA